MASCSAHLARWALLSLVSPLPLCAQVEWTERDTVPPGTLTPLMAYDSARQRVVAYVESQTWEWDGSGWNRVRPTNDPGLVGTAAMAYDSGRARTVLFSGTTTDTWEWDGTDWTLRSPPVAPTVSSIVCLAYDATRSQTVLAMNPAQTWTWDGTSWSRAIGATPSIFGMAYDVRRQRIVARGRQSPSPTDTWEWDGTGWTALGTTTPIAHTLSYDTVRQRVIGLVNGGAGSGAIEVWEFDGAAWNLRAPAATPPPGLVTPGVAYDQTRRQLVVFGGSRYDYVPILNPIPVRDTWLWDGTAWSEWPRPVPAARQDHAMVYDSARERVLLFGGLGEGQLWNDLWSWDGTVWTELATASAPSARRRPAMAYDSARDRVVMFGAGQYFPLDDTWEWDGQQWVQLNPAVRPPAGAHPMVYDAARQRCVLVTAGLAPETWEWDGATWTRRLPATALSTVSARLAYDARRERVVLNGGDPGLTASETWEWDGTDWTRRNPPTGNLPVRSHAMVYDHARDRIVVFGGIGNPYGSRLFLGTDQTWEWDGATWQRRSAPPPSYWRSNHAMAYDVARQKTVLFGGLFDWDPYGSADDVILGDTWEYSATEPAAFDPFGNGCAGSAGTPTLGAPAFALPWLGESFATRLTSLPPGNATAVFYGSSTTSWGALTLPFDLSVVGMTGCILFTGGESVLPVANIGGTAAWSTVIPAVPALVGQAYYNQGMVSDVGANPLGVVVSNAACARVGQK